MSAFAIPLGWGDLFKRTIDVTQARNGLGLAAQLAYYFFLAVFPAMLFLIALASFFRLDNVTAWAMDSLAGVAPPEVLAILQDQLAGLSEAGHGGMLTLGVLAALWSGSAAMVAIIDALNRAYGVEDSRPWWKQRLTAILLTVGVAFFVLLSFVVVVAGPQLARAVVAGMGLGPAIEWTWMILQWPVAFALVAFAVGLIYYFAPDVDQDWTWITPGSLAATALWLVGSLGFRFYVVNFGGYNEMYGAIGGVMVLMLWFYLSGLVIIVGAQMNAQIEHASPHAKAAGERQPGERLTVGARAARRFEERRRREGARERERPSARRVPPPQTAPGIAAARIGVMVAGAMAALFGRRAGQ